MKTVGQSSGLDIIESGNFSLLHDVVAAITNRSFKQVDQMDLLKVWEVISTCFPQWRQELVALLTRFAS